ncbi:MAG: hypothetical protein ACRDZ4_08865 [Egibacteraceae bacterium]
MQTLPRPRLDSKMPLYRSVTELADHLEQSAQDLWADNLRACLCSRTASEVFADLGLELYRLRHSTAARRLRLVETVDELIATVKAAVGPTDAEHLPLYCMLKDLVDLLRLDGGVRWARRLEAAIADEGLSDAARITRVGAELDQMALGSPGVPPGSAPRVAAVRQRLARIRDTSAATRCLSSALRPLG